MVSTAHRDAIVLTLGMVGVGWIMSVYYLYYLKVFLDKYHLPSGYLQIVQILFLVWNAINDPIMGYMQDLGCCGMTWIMDRRKVVLYAGPFFSFSFLLFWFPWSTSIAWVTGLQLLVSLFVFDTLLTLCLSAYCGLCVEKSEKHHDRVRVTIYGELFGLLAGMIIIPLESVTHNLDYFGVFQICCVFIACVGAGCMVFCGTQLSRDEVTQEERDDINEKNELSNDWRSVLKISWQIIKEWRFVCLVGGQFFKILRFMGNETLLIIFVESLLVQSGFLERGSSLVGLYYVLARSLGSVLFLLLWIPVNRLGCQWVIQGLNVATLLNCGMALLAGHNNHTWIFGFLLLENALSRCGWQGYYMVIAGEVIDTDKRKHERRSPLSTIIFTMKALFNKPADQLAPIILLALLDAGGYSMHKAACISHDVTTSNSTLSVLDDIIGSNSTSTLISTSTIDPLVCDTMFSSMFQAMVLFPACCAIGESLFVAFDQWIRKRELKQLKNDMEMKQS